MVTGLRTRSLHPVAERRQLPPPLLMRRITKPTRPNREEIIDSNPSLLPNLRRTPSSRNRTESNRASIPLRTILPQPGPAGVDFIRPELLDAVEDLRARLQSLVLVLYGFGGILVEDAFEEDLIAVKEEELQPVPVDFAPFHR